jgi:hypothetical protein
MVPSHLSPSSKPLTGRYLSFVQREEIALLRAQGHGVREIARRLARAPSTISRELRRNAAARGGELDYRATTAQWHADRSARRPKPAKLAVNGRLRGYVQDRLAGKISAPDGAALSGPRRHGRAAGTGLASTAGGRRRGARSRSLADCGWTSRTTRRFASVTRPSTNRSMSKAGERSAAS